jgi:hypothetical protein
VEHCDTAVAGQRPAKGFLALEDELDALDALRAPAADGVLINWGRSAIEGRGPERVLHHIQQTRERGLLRGLMFSGCSASGVSRGGAWADVHLPPFPVDQDSVLTAESAAEAVTAAGGCTALEVLGMKIGAPADAGLTARATILRDSTTAFTAALGL